MPKLIITDRSGKKSEIEYDSNFTLMETPETMATILKLHVEDVALVLPVMFILMKNGQTSSKIWMMMKNQC